MAIAYASIAQATGGSSTTLTVGKPSGLAEGDLMVFGFSTDNSTSTALSGWTKIGGAAPGTNRVFGIFYKIASSADAAASDFTITLGTSRFWGGFIIRATGAAVDVQSDTDSVASDSTPSYPGGITPGQASSLLLFLVSIDNNSTTTTSVSLTTSNPTWTERPDQQYSGGVGGSLSVATAIRTESTATGNYNATLSATANSAGLILSFGASINESVTLDVVSLTATPKEPVIAGDANVTLDVVSLTSTPKDPTTTTQVDGKWKNTSKNAATNVTNTSKS